MRRALDGVVATLVLVTMVGAGFCQNAVQVTAQPESGWTVMIYMAADNSVPLPWESDINEMEAAEQDEQTNIVVLLDILGAPNSELLRISHDPNGLDSTIVSANVDDGGAVIDAGEVNTGATSTLDSFVRFCASEYPAQRYVLFLWGHGAAWHGLCPDGFDFLTLSELRAALQASTESIGRPLDLVAVDACAQGSMEMICQLEDIASVFVASEKDVPYEGLPYAQVLDSLAADPGQTPLEFGRSIADQYYLWSTINSLYAATIAVFDMRGVERMALSLATLSSVGLEFSSLFHPTMQMAAKNSEHYENEWHIDFGDFLQKLGSSDVPLELKQAVLDTILVYSQLTSYTRSYSKPDPIDEIWANRSTGAVIYFKGSNITDSEYTDLEISATGWDQYGFAVREDSAAIENEPGPLVSYQDPDSDFLPDAIELTWYGSYDEYRVLVYREIAGGLQYVATELSTNGTVVIEGIPGRLELSVSASTAGTVRSYRVINESLEGESYLEVVVWNDGERVEEGIEIRMVSDKDSQSFADMPPPFMVPVSIPTFAEIGDLVAVQVIDTDSGKVVGESKTVVSESQWSVEVEVHEPTQEAPAIAVLALVLLPGLIVLAYAYLLSRNPRRSS